MRQFASTASCGALLVAALACGTPAPPPPATEGAPAAAPAFAPFDSVSLVAPCLGTVTPAEDTTYRARVAGAAAHPGVLVYAAPTPERPCYQLGVTSAAVRDSLAEELGRARVPGHVVTYFHLRAVPPDDIDRGAAAPGDP